MSLIPVDNAVYIACQSMPHMCRGVPQTVKVADVDDVTLDDIGLLMTGEKLY